MMPADHSAAGIHRSQECRYRRGYDSDSPGRIKNNRQADRKKKKTLNIQSMIYFSTSLSGSSSYGLCSGTSRKSSCVYHTHTHTQGLFYSPVQCTPIVYAQSIQPTSQRPWFPSDFSKLLSPFSLSFASMIFFLLVNHSTNLSSINLPPPNPLSFLPRLLLWRLTTSNSQISRWSLGRRPDQNNIR